MQIKQRITELRRVRAGDLVANPRNWRTHPPEQRAALEGLLAEIGYADALIARQGDDGRLHLIDGHLRAETTPDTEVPVLVTDLTAAEADRVLLTLDPLAAMAGRDQANLEALAAEFETKSDALMQMVQDLTGPAYAELLEPEMPDPGGKPTAKPGDLWALGRHRLLCGNPAREDDARLAIGDAAPAMMITAMPYGQPGDAPASALQHYKGAVAYAWHRWDATQAAASDLEAAGFEIRAQIIWSRTGGAGDDYTDDHEPCWYAVRKGESARWAGDRKQSTVWEIPAGPAARPIDCCGRPMQNHGAAGDAIYDPFPEDGATLLAAEQTERTAIAIASTPGQADTIIQRWQVLAGGKAKRIKQ